MISQQISLENAGLQERGKLKDRKDPTLDYKLMGYLEDRGLKCS